MKVHRTTRRNARRRPRTAHRTGVRRCSARGVLVGAWKDPRSRGTGLAQARHTRHAAGGLATRWKGIGTGVKRRLWELSALVSGTAAAAACRRLMTVLGKVSRNE